MGYPYGYPSEGSVDRIASSYLLSHEKVLLPVDDALFEEVVVEELKFEILGKALFCGFAHGSASVRREYRQVDRVGYIIGKKVT